MKAVGRAFCPETLKIVPRCQNDNDIAFLVSSLLELRATALDNTIYQKLLRNLLLQTVELEQTMSRLNDALYERQQQMDRDLQAAATIQRNLLPRKTPQIPGYDFAWKFQPCDRVGGDIFFVIPIGPTGLVMAVLDVSGHGVPAAMVTVSASQFLQPSMEYSMELDRSGVPRPRRPEDVLRDMELEFPIARFGRFFTVVYAVLDTESHRLRLANGGHPHPILTSPGKAAESLGVTGPLIGMLEDSDFPELQRTLQKGDRIWMFSDCLEETAAGDRSRFERRRLEILLNSLTEQPLAEAVETVYSEIKRFADGQPLEDDFTLLAMEKMD